MIHSTLHITIHALFRQFGIMREKTGINATLKTTCTLEKKNQNVRIGAHED